MLHVLSLYFCGNLFFLLFFIFFLGSFNKKNMSSERILTDLDQDVDLVENCSLPQILKKDLMDFMFWGEFIVEDWEPEALFKKMDRAAVYDILSYIVSLQL